MILFILCQLACTSVGLYKCWSMGLLPTEASDWLAWYKGAQVGAPVHTALGIHPEPRVTFAVPSWFYC